jgi:hypothetical protein
MKYHVASKSTENATQMSTTTLHATHVETEKRQKHTPRENSNRSCVRDHVLQHIGLRYADLRRAVARVQRPRTASSAAKGKVCVICVHPTCVLPPPLPPPHRRSRRASPHGVSRYSWTTWLVHGHASLQKAASVTRPFLVPFHLPHWAAATTERRHARIERARRGARQLVAQQQWQHDRSGAAAQAKIGPRPVLR